MEITTKFNIGDKVWTLTTDNGPMQGEVISVHASRRRMETRTTIEYGILLGNAYGVSFAVESKIAGTEQELLDKHGYQRK